MSTSNQENPEPGPGQPPQPGLDDAATVRRESASRPDESPVPPLTLAGHHPLRDSDPVKVGDFWLDSRLTASPAGVAYAAHPDGGDAVLLLLLSEGAAGDAAARARFSGEINAMHIDTVVARGGENQDEGRMGVRYRGEDDDPELLGLAPLAPWAALAFDGSLRAVEEADRILQAIDLSHTPPLSEPSGPDYQLHWLAKTGPGTTRVWPLAWPGRTDRGGWISLLVAFLIMVLITALALLLAILIFQNQAPVDAPQPIPSSAPQSPTTDSSQSTSGSPQSPSSSGNTPGPYSHSPSMNVPSGDDSGQGDPSVNPRL